MDMMILLILTSWLRLYCLYFGKFPIFSCYAAKFSAELYKQCIMIISFSSIFIYEYLSIWIDKTKSLHMKAVIGFLPVKAVKQIKGGALHLEAIIESLLVKAVKTIGFFYFGGNWPAESLQFKGMWVPLWDSTV